MSDKYIVKSVTIDSIPPHQHADEISPLKSPRYDEVKARAKSAPPKPDISKLSPPFTQVDDKSSRKSSLSARILDRKSSLIKSSNESRIKKLEKKRYKILKTMEKLQAELVQVESELALCEPLRFSSLSSPRAMDDTSTSKLVSAWADREEEPTFSPNAKYIDEEAELCSTEDSVEIFAPRYKTNPKVKGFLEYVEDNDESDDDEEFIDDSLALNVSAKGFLDYIEEEDLSTNIQEEIEIINEYEQDRNSEIAKRVRGQWIIQAGTVEQLVNRLASANPIDGYYTRNFILTYSYFTTSSELLDELIKRFQFEPPMDSSIEVISYYEKWRGPVRLRHSSRFSINVNQCRVINVLKKWIEINFSDVRKDPALVNRFVQFVKEIGHDYEKWAETMMGLLLNPQRKNEIEQEFVENSATPKPFLPISTIQSLSDIHPTELARQLTIYEWKMFIKIDPSELRSCNWGKPNKTELAPNVVKLTGWFNKLSYWIATEIIKPDVKVRVKNLMFWITVADECRKINNFNSCMEILAALGLICVSRLKRTWKELTEKFKLTYQELEDLLTSFQNFKNYRRELDKADETGIPTLPYLGVFLRDLLFLEEGNSDRLANGMVHFQKMSMVANVIAKIQQFQRLPFNFKPVEEIQAFFQRQQDGLILDEDTLFEYSKIYEPPHAPTIDRPVPLRERRMTITDFRSFVKKANFSPLPNSVPEIRSATNSPLHFSATPQSNSPNSESSTPVRHNSLSVSTVKGKLEPFLV